MSPATTGATGPRFTLELERKTDAAGARYTVVHCRGLLVAGLTDNLHSEVKPLMVAQHRVVLDLTELTRLDSMGLGAIVSLAVSAKRADCEFELVNLGKQIRQLFAITNLLTLFESAGDNTFRII